MRIKVINGARTKLIQDAYFVFTSSELALTPSEDVMTVGVLVMLESKCDKLVSTRHTRATDIAILIRWVCRAVGSACGSAVRTVIVAVNDGDGTRMLIPDVSGSIHRGRNAVGRGGIVATRGGRRAEAACMCAATACSWVRARR